MDDTVREREAAYLDACHRIGNHLLEVMDDASRRTGAPYFLTSGTLLGCVRSEGWIPWDDDVDVIMFRDDFTRFSRAVPPLLPEDVVFSSGATNERHITAIPRLLHRHSHRFPHGRTRADRPDDMTHVPLDIFVLDRAPRTEPLRTAWRFALYVLDRMNVASRTSVSDVLTEPTISARRRVPELLTVIASRVSTPTRWSRLRDRTAAMWSRLSTDGPYMATNYSTPHGRRLVIYRDWYFPGSEAVFEGRTRPVPGRTEVVLTSLYGPGYLTPPSGDEQHPAHLRNGLRAELDGKTWDIR